MKKKILVLVKRFKAYIKRLLFPLYLFPIKIITYSTYYTVKFFVKTTVSFAKMLFEMIIYPFRSLKNLFKSLFFLAVTVYMGLSLFVITDYIKKNYGWVDKFVCSFGTTGRLKNQVVRIVGGYSEGSGFFVSSHEVITNFHVIADEPAPKVIFPDGTFVTPTKITGDKNADLALLYLDGAYPEMVLNFPETFILIDNEPLLAVGYPLGTDLAGEATVVKGNFATVRQSKYYPVSYLQTDISLVEGMSGGPLTDQCGSVVGINTMSLAGLSLFIAGNQVHDLISNFTDQEIVKIEVDTTTPEGAVTAFYTYLKARRMEEGFALLSEQYLTKTNYEEWTARFTDILDVEIITTRPADEGANTVFVKFSTKNWNDGEVDYHFYEGTWETVPEEGIYKMNKSKIKEIFDPDWDWYYSPDPTP